MVWRVSTGDLHFVTCPDSLLVSDISEFTCHGDDSMKMKLVKKCESSTVLRFRPQMVITNFQSENVVVIFIIKQCKLLTVKVYCLEY